VLKRFVAALTLVTISFFYCGNLFAQTDRLHTIQQRLTDLSQNVPGLTQTIETSISNGTLKEFLRGLASTHSLNLNIDPNLNQRITSYFSDEKVMNVLLYLAKEYNLDLTFTGSIISIAPYKDPLANQPPPPKELPISFNTLTQSVTMDLKEDTLLNVAKKITQLSGRNVIVQPEIYNKKVTGYIQELPVENALEKLAITNGFKLNKTNDDVYILEPLKQNEEIVAKTNPIGNPNFSIRTLTNGANGSSSSSINILQNNAGKQLISLNVVNSPIKDIIKQIAEQAGINYFVYSELAGNTTAHVQNMEFDKLLSFVLQGTKYTYNVSNGIYMIGDRQNEGLRAHQLIQLKYRSVDSLLTSIPQELKQGVDIKEFKELNSFLLSGSQPQIKEIETFVKALDRTVPMVLIEVILMDIKKSKTIESGIKMGVGDSIKTGGTLLGGLDFTLGSGSINRFIQQIGLNNIFNIGRVTPNFYVSLKALESNSNVNLRQTPKLSTLNGHSAKLSIGSTRYYVQKTQNTVGSLNPSTIVTEQYIPIEANMLIGIKPFISGDEQVTMNINIDISDFLTSEVANAPPPSSSSKFESIIRVRNEEMIVLGGIERTEKSDDGSGVPFLSRIPVLKWLFSSRTKVDSKTVSVVFIKPTIIY
jgi:type IV pilus assembly protein PilQ